MLDKDLCKILNVDPFQEYVVNKMEAIEDTLRVTETMPKYYSTINKMLKGDYDFLKKVRDFYSDYKRENEKRQSKTYWDIIKEVQEYREEFLKRYDII